MNAESANTGRVDRLDLNDAVERLLTPKEDSNPAPSKDEVTEAEEATEVSASEAAVTEAQSDSTNVETEPKEETEEEPDEDSEEDTEEEEGDEDQEDEEADDEDQDEPEEESEELTDDTVLFTDSEGNEVTVEEAKRGYLRQSDYTRKTQALAEERTQLQQVSQRVGQERQVLAENLNIALDVIEPQLAKLAQTDWDTLSREDPYEYTEKRAQYDIAQHRYNQIVAQSQQLVAQQKQQAEQAKQQWLAQESQALQQAIPDLADPTKSQKLRSRMKEYAVDYGLKPEQAGLLGHSLVIRLIKDSMDLAELKSSGLTAAKKKVAKTPKRVVQAGRRVSKSERANEARQQQRAALRATGSDDIAVDLLLGG